MAKQGFGTRRETFTLLTVRSIAIQLPSSERDRRIEQIVASYGLTFAATDNFALGRVSVVRSLFDNPVLQLSQSGDLPQALGEVVFDAFPSEPFTSIIFPGGGLRLTPREDYTVILHNPVTSAAYQDFTAGVVFPSENIVGALSVYGTEGGAADIFPNVR